MTLFKISCPYCRKRIPLSSLRCPECRSVIPHECGEEERERIFKRLGRGGLVAAAIVVGLVVWMILG